MYGCLNPSVIPFCCTSEYETLRLGSSHKLSSCLGDLRRLRKDVLMIMLGF